MSDDMNALATVTKAIMEAVMEPVKDLLLKLAGPATEELGLTLGEQVRLFRFKRQIRLLTRTKQMLEDADISPKQVPLKLLYPLIQNGQLEEDDSLQDKWAALLANSCKEGNQVLPSFTEILKQITPDEAKFLDSAYDEISEGGRGPKHPIKETTLGALSDVMIGDLERLGLIDRHNENTEFTSPLKHHTFEATNHLYVSMFGREFIRACRPPKTRSSSCLTSA
jgi:Abortive infection alpha